MFLCHQDELTSNNVALPAVSDFKPHHPAQWGEGSGGDGPRATSEAAAPGAGVQGHEGPRNPEKVI